MTPTIDELSGDPHPHLAALRAAGPVTFVDALGGWLVTARDVAVEVLRDAGDVHRRRPALLDGPRRRAEHAVDRRRGAHPAPPAVRRRRSGRAR